MASIAYVDSPGVGVDDRQPGIACRYPLPQFAALRPVHPPRFQPLESGHLSSCHANSSKSDYSDPGSARLAKGITDSPAGLSRTFFKARLTTNQCIAAAEVTLKDGHKA